MRRFYGVALGVVLTGSLSVALQAQSSTPKTYSFTEDPAISVMAPTVITLSRDGSKEVVDQVMAPSQGRPKEFHAHLLYDFQAHTIYTKILSDPSTPCSVMTYTSSEVPSAFDVISGSADLMEGFSGEGVQSKETGSETVNGIAAKVLEISSPGQGTARVWIAKEGNFPVKIMMIGPDGKEHTMIEVRHLSFAKPPASMFVPPAGCQRVQGESTESGGHAVIGAGAKQAAASAPNAKVTAVTLQAIPDYTGVCPAHVRMTGTITSNGRGTVWYQFGAGKLDPGETLIFQAAGTRTVTHVMTLTVDPKFGDTLGGSALLQAAMEDSNGGHDSDSQSANADFSVTCKR